VLIKDEVQAKSYMRYAGDEAPYRVLTQSTTDGGKSWSRPEKISILNPNSALAGLRDESRILLVLNNTEDERDRLSLEISDDNGQSWQTHYLFEDRSQYAKGSLSKKAFLQLLRHGLQQTKRSQQRDTEQLLKQVSKQTCRKGACAFQYDYPYIIRSRNGDYHLLYTWNRSLIKHVRFNDAWLEQLQ
jgi:predicted neuraminidase